MNSNINQLKTAIQLALDGDWHAAHEIVQDLQDAESCWIHAVLHKIEGDQNNSRYWYARTIYEFEDFKNPHEELKYIASCIIDE